MAQYFWEFWTRPPNCTWKNTYLVKFLAPAEQLCIKNPLIKLCSLIKSGTEHSKESDYSTSSEISTFSSSLSTSTNASLLYESSTSSSSTESKNSDSDSEANSTTELYAITFTNLTKEN